MGMIQETADLIATFAARRLRFVDEVRRDALDRDALARGGDDARASTEIVLRGLRLELAAALRITEHAAGDLLAMSEALVHRYPAVLDLLERAATTEQHARVLVDVVSGVSPGVRDRVLDAGVAWAQTLPVGVFRHRLRTLAESLEAATLDVRHERAIDDRRVVVEQAADGMAWLHLYAPAVEIHAIHGRATRIAKQIDAGGGDDDRTLDQVRADVLCDLLIDGETALFPERARGIRATTVVTVPALALIDGVAGATDAAVVEGLGPIPLETARRLAGGDGTWMRVLTHPETGMVLSVGRDSYRPPASLQRLVKWRADRCMAPGCLVPASRCQIDHQVDWAHDGETSLENNAPFCQGHHTIKHHSRWRVRQVPGSGGAIEWTSPSGRVYTVLPERRVPVFTPSTVAGAGGDEAPF
ncbi:DUF222 domain-containing protein [Microbacterium hominis]|uniref:DUF222 domain-containing protein n=2 Tax=Microbacterium hominis TaxID=162426 RepID=A0A7D4U9X6_9MICO|nr:DUF222 domain-containing protein [Microbacterium hominis]